MRTLTFADYIHDTYIADGGWKESAWTALMGSATLVDLVNQIWNVASQCGKPGEGGCNQCVECGEEWYGVD